MADQKYLFSQIEEQAEYERLQMQEETADWISRGRLSSLGLSEGARCLEAGVGAGSMARWMASQVAPSGSVLGVDLDDRFFAASSVPNLELRKEDLLTTGLDEASF